VRFEWPNIEPASPINLAHHWLGAERLFLVSQMLNHVSN